MRLTLHRILYSPLNKTEVTMNALENKRENLRAGSAAARSAEPESELKG